jgi:hypothetical protein
MLLPKSQRIVRKDIAQEQSVGQDAAQEQSVEQDAAQERSVEHSLLRRDGSLLTVA